MTDRRASARRKTYLGGRVVFNHRQSTLDCRLRNMGESGAKLQFDHPAFVPDEFDVQVARLERVYRARVTWRSRSEIGISFGQPASAANVVPLDQAVRIRRLEADRAALQRRIAELSGAE